MTKKEKRRQVGHILAGFIILVHAYEEYEKRENPWFHIVASIVFLGVAIFHHSLSKRIKWIDGIFYFIEGFVLFYTAYEYYHHGKKALPIAYLAAGVGYMIAAWLISRKNMRIVADTGKDRIDTTAL